MGNVSEIEDEQTWSDKVDNAPGRVMVEFFVTWCPHCQRETPVLDAVAPQIERRGVGVYRANAQVMWTKGDVYGLTETPSFIVVEGGRMVAKHVGFMDADQLVAFATASDQGADTFNDQRSSFDAFSEMMREPL